MTYIISAFILGLSIVLSAFILSNSISDLGNKNSNPEPITITTPDIMTITQLSSYLEITVQSIEIIINDDDLMKAKLSSYDTYQFIPYLKIDNQERFLKTEIDKWLQYKSENG